MKNKITEIKEVVSQRDLENGSLILLAGRPAVGKTKTICDIIKKYKDKYEYLYFDFDGNSTYFLNDETRGIIKEYQSSVSIIQTIQREIKNNLKFVFIDYWQLLENTDSWFTDMLYKLAMDNKLVIIVASVLDRKVQYRKNEMPKECDLKKIRNIYARSNKVIVISQPCPSPKEFTENKRQEPVYYMYKGF